MKKSPTDGFVDIHHHLIYGLDDGAQTWEQTQQMLTQAGENGIRRIIAGTVLLDETFRSSIERHRDVLIAGIDAKNSMVATHGWKKVSGMHAVDMIRECRALGIREFIYTDIATDGMLTGPNLEAIRGILTDVPGIDLIASGGISSMDDIEQLARLEVPVIRGCITGKAIYDGRIDLKTAIARFV